MTFQRIVGIVIGLTFVGGLIGAGVGRMLGMYTPDLYVSLFHAYDPVEFGIGIGFANGATMGSFLVCSWWCASPSGSGEIRS